MASTRPAANVCLPEPIAPRARVASRLAAGGLHRSSHAGARLRPSRSFSRSPRQSSRWGVFL